MEYYIKREGVILASVLPTGRQTKKIMDVNLVDMAFSLPVMVDFSIGDYVDVYGERYYIAGNIPPVHKLSSIQFDYTLQFKGQAYKLLDAQMFGLDGANNLTQSDFAVMGTADVIIDLMLQNANRFQSGWVKGTIDITRAENHIFSGDNCLAVLAKLADTYKLEWWVDGQTIHMTKKGEVQNITFEYGKGKGLYDIDRNPAPDKNIYTRLYPYGSTDNLPGDYRSFSKRLMLPDGQLYLERNVDKFGIIEKVEFFDDIKPEYIGTVTNAINNFNFQDSGINFDINSSQLATTKPKVSFLTGQLAGYSFEIGGYDVTSKTIRIVKLENEKAIDLPNDLLKPAVGDTFSLLDLNMPVPYRSIAENKLQVEGQNLLDQNSDANVVYSVTCDPINFRQRNVSISLGNYVKVIDADFGLNKNIRVSAYTRDLINQFDYTLDLQEVITVAQIVRQYQTYVGIKSAVAINKLSDINRARMNWKTSQELRNMVYDPEDGYFDPKNIRPKSIETLMLSVGAKSQQFLLGGVLFSPNYGGDPTRFFYTTGQLTHFTIADNPVTWNIISSLITGLTPATAYYIYAKCDKNSNDGSIILSDQPIKVEQLTGFYVFWVGTLHSVIDGVRGISLTYGQTTINGRFITTGRVQSNTSETYFDLDEGIIAGKIQFGDAGNSTIIDGKLVTTSTIIFGDSAGQHAGMTGEIAAPGGVVNLNSVLIFAGSTFADRADAPFRVTAAGSVVMTQADITGIITALSGRIGNWNISSGGIVNTDGTAYIIARDNSGGTTAEARIGTNVFPATSGVVGVAYFENSKTNTFGTNYGAVFIASGGALNIAAEFTGYASFLTGIAVGPDRTIGKTQELQYQGPDRDYRMQFINGVYVGNYGV